MCECVCVEAPGRVPAPHHGCGDPHMCTCVRAGAAKIGGRRTPSAQHTKKDPMWCRLRTLNEDERRKRKRLRKKKNMPQGKAQTPLEAPITLRGPRQPLAGAPARMWQKWHHGG